MKALKAKYFWGIPANRWLKATYSKWKYSAVRGILVNISNVLFYIIHLNMERFNRNICGFCCLIVVLKWTAPPVTPQARQLSPSCDRLHCIHMVFSWVLLVNRHRFMCIYTQTHVERKKTECCLKAAGVLFLWEGDGTDASLLGQDFLQKAMFNLKTD